jgi:hypothetical protein
MAAMTRISNWLPHSSDVLNCTGWNPSGETIVKAFDSSRDVAVGHSCAGDDEAIQLHIPELYCQNHTFGNVGGRICGIAARHDVDTDELQVAASTASHAASQIPGTVADGEGEVQIWTIGQEWILTCRLVITHPGGRSDAVEWCPSTDAFSGDVDGCNRTGAAPRLLLLVANESVLIYSVPMHPADVVPLCFQENECACLCCNLRST